MLRKIGSFLAWLMLAGAAFSAEPPRVVASLPPLQGLAASVLEGIAEPELLVRSGGSAARTTTRIPLSARQTAVVKPITPAPTTMTSIGSPYERRAGRACRNRSARTCLDHRHLDVGAHGADQREAGTA